MDNLKASSQIALSGLRAQSFRMRLITENIANASSTGETPGADPYVRKLTTFKEVFDRGLKAELVKTGAIKRDSSPFALRYEPGHPAADASGYVKYPNVKSLIEFQDMREAQLSYSANLNVITTTKQLTTSTLDLLR